MQYTAVYELIIIKLRTIWKCHDLNPGRLGEKRERYRCVMPTPLKSSILIPRSSPRKGFSEAATFQSPQQSLRPPSSRRDRLARRDEDCFGSEMYREDFTEEFDFEKNLALFDKRLVFEEISASNQPDVIRLVDINRRKATPTQFGETSEPKFRNDQVIISALLLGFVVHFSILVCLGMNVFKPNLSLIV